MTTYTPRPEPRMLRDSIAATFALAALAMLLAARWLRFLVPVMRTSPRVRDVSWLRQQGR